MLAARTRATGVLLAASAVVAGSLATAAPATARPVSSAHSNGKAHPYIAIPVARVVDATANSLTVAAHAHNATHYKVWASTRRSAVYYSAILSPRSSAPHSGVSRTAMTVGNLPYTVKPYWFRVVAINGKHTRYSPIYEAGVMPQVPTNLHVGRNHKQAFITWSANAAGEVVQQSTNSSFSSGVQTFHVRGAGSQFTPTNLNKNQTYYLRVRADNYGTASSWSSPVAVQRSGGTQNLKVMTFNILEASTDGSSEGGQRVAPWSKRRGVAAHLIHQVMPDVISIQEGWPFVGHHQRQVVSLQHALGTGYALAHTEIAPGHRHWMRTGDYILYRKANLRAVGHGNHWTLSGGKTDKFAAYQILQSRASGAKFLFVAAHLRVGRGSNFDAVREQQTKNLVRKASAYASHHGGIPVVYAGDFNSHSPNATVTFDGPGAAMRGAHMADAISVARSESKTAYDSANLYQRRPPKTYASIDHVYVSPGVGVDNWTQVIDLSHGRYVGVMASDHNPVVADLGIPY